MKPTHAIKQGPKKPYFCELVNMAVPASPGFVLSQINVHNFNKWPKMCFPPFFILAPPYQWHKDNSQVLVWGIGILLWISSIIKNFQLNPLYPRGNVKEKIFSDVFGSYFILCRKKRSCTLVWGSHRLEAENENWLN